MRTAKEYLQELDAVVGRHFAPDGIYHGPIGAMRFARELGYGLADFPEGQRDVQSTYSLLVKHTFGTKNGVPIDAKKFFDEVRWAIQYASFRWSTIDELDAHIQEAEQHKKKIADRWEVA